MAKKATKRKSIYGVHPGVLMTQKWIAELKQKTGRSLDEWSELIKKDGPPTEAARREWLKQEHGLGTNSAWWLAERSVGKGEESADLRCAAETRFVCRQRHEGMSVSDDSAALSQSRFRAN
jgi:hypothetical protein